MNEAIGRKDSVSRLNPGHSGSSKVPRKETEKEWLVWSFVSHVEELLPFISYAKLYASTTTKKRCFAEYTHIPLVCAFG